MPTELFRWVAVEQNEFTAAVGASGSGKSTRGGFMKRHLLWVLPLCVFLAAMAFGMIKRQTYKDVFEQKNYLDQLTVAELPEDFVERQCAILSERLPQVPVILRVEVEGEIEHLFHVDRQKIIIREVYAGEGLTAGEEYYLFSRSWSVALNEQINSLERGFVNILKVGEEYLIFATEVLQDLNGDLSAIKLYDEYLISPVFCYEECENVVAPLLGETLGVPYKDVKNNEFFAASEKGMKMLKEFKGKMLSLYPR